MEQINPRETVPLVWRNPFPNDSATYYVQAKIYNSLTRVLIDTINLTPDINGLFYGSFIAPGDSSGSGFKIDANIDVYTDSNYTIHSENHSQENAKYLVQTRLNAVHTGFGGGGIDINYNKIQKIIEAAIANINIPNYSKDFLQTYNKVNDLKVDIENLKKVVNLDKTSIITEKIDTVSRGINDLSESLKNEIKDSFENSSKVFDNLTEQVITGFENLANSVGNTLDKTEVIVKDTTDIKELAKQEIKLSTENKKGISNLNKAFSSVDTVIRAEEKGIPEPEELEEPEEVDEPKIKQKDFSTIAKLLSQ